MLFRTLVTVLAGGLAFQTAAIPLSESVVPARREVPVNHVLHERHLPAVARTWSKRSKVPSEVTLPLRIGLKQSNLQEGHDKLMDM